MGWGEGIVGTDVWMMTWLTFVVGQRLSSRLAGRRFASLLLDGLGVCLATRLHSNGIKRAEYSPVFGENVEIWTCQDVLMSHGLSHNFLCVNEIHIR